MRLVQQEPVLFSGSVFENVRKGLVGAQRDLSRDEQMKLVQEACIASNAHDFVSDLPNGYDTEVGERAGMLSGGQKQRLAIARSIISDPSILLLDEATSALDPRAERVVQDALDKASANRTTLIIAHKLATVMSADSIAVMSAGVLVEQGTHAELIEKGGYYAALVSAQDLGGKQQDPEKHTDQTALLESDHDDSLQLTKSKTRASAYDDIEQQKLTAGTVNYGLIKSIVIMLAEQKGLRLTYAFAVLSCIMGGATFPAQAILFSRLLDIFQLTGQAAQDQANFYSLMFFVVAIGNLVAYVILGWTCNIMSQTVTHRYRHEMFKHVVNQDIDFSDHAEHSSGGLTSNLVVYPTQLQELISANVLLIIIVLVNVLSSSILAIAYGWKLGLVVVFGGLPILIGSGYYRIKIESREEPANSKQFAKSAGLASEAVTSIRTVASLTLEREVLQQYSTLLSGISRRALRTLLWTMFWFALSQSIEFLVMALGFWYGAQLLSTGEYTTGQFYVIFIGVVFAGNAAGQFFGYSTSITKAKGAANYILWLRTLRPKMQDTSTTADQKPEGDGAVALEDVEFRYQQREASRVLRGISLTIKPGQYVAFVGPSGCGKSTLISLLERFYDPTSGTITLSSRDIATLSPRLYRAELSLVQQEPTLYQGSVRENICLGLPEEFLSQHSDQELEAKVKEALKQANALDFVLSLPQDLNTPCGSKGSQFSGGQRQRIAIARALIRRPNLLLLDEATSALDTHSERLVQATLDEAAKKRTTVAVAHRLSTIKGADCIYVFGDGRVAEAGKHEELLGKRGRYYEMCMAQSLDRTA